MRSILVAAFVFCAACAPDDTLVVIPICGLDCAIDRNGEIVVGESAQELTCNVGTVVCADGIETCEGWTPYGAEVCDEAGVDEDCNGSANDISYSPLSDRNTCDGLGVCANAIQQCQDNGTWVCVPLSDFFGPEVCDGVDNDCDGLVDSADPDMADGDFVYSGPPGSVNIGECRAGVSRCIDGKLSVFGEVLPQREVCGNGDDDDCDGLTDEPDTQSDPVAIMLVLDFSGSMYGTIHAVTNAICGLSANGLLANSKFAAVSVAADGYRAPHLETITDFTDVQTACDTITSYLRISGLYGGLEYVPEAIISSNDANSDLYLAWPESLAREVIFFTDEEPQGFNESASEAISAAVESCNSNNYSVSGFTSYPLEWAPLIDECRGWHETLGTQSADMTASIQERFLGKCID